MGEIRWPACCGQPGETKGCGVGVWMLSHCQAPRRPRMKKHARIGCRSPEASDKEDGALGKTLGLEGSKPRLFPVESLY